MSSVDQVRQETEALGEVGLDHITEQLIAEYQDAFPEEDGSDVAVRGTDGQAGELPEVEGEAVAATRVYYGNRYLRLGNCLYWKTNGVGQPCGTGFTARACNWRSVAVTQVARCVGGYAGYRFTFTY